MTTWGEQVQAPLLEPEEFAKTNLLQSKNVRGYYVLNPSRTQNPTDGNQIKRAISWSRQSEGFAVLGGNRIPFARSDGAYGPGLEPGHVHRGSRDGGPDRFRTRGQLA